MVLAIGGISSHKIDPEYMKILQELRSLGIAPSGDKNIDKAKLAQAKTELIEKIQHKQEKNEQQSLQVQTISPVDDIENGKRAEMEEQRLGAMNVAELNKIFHHLK